MCIASRAMKDDTGQVIIFPCGKCHVCYQRRIAGWSFRLSKEGTAASSSFFVTLSYNDEFVPLSPENNLTLKKRDTQLLFKRLRKVSGHTSPRKIKYYVCGEYGDKFERPHYHIILFNVELETLIGPVYALQVELGNIPLDGKYKFPSEIWGNGHITIGEVSEQSIAYTLNYMLKTRKIPYGTWDDRKPEFSTMSKGIGTNYLTPEIIAWHKADLLNRLYLPILGGGKVALPRYYRDKIYTESELEVINPFLQDKFKTEWLEENLEEKIINSKITKEKVRKYKQNQRLTETL